MGWFSVERTPNRTQNGLNILVATKQNTMMKGMVADANQFASEQRTRATLLFCRDSVLAQSSSSIGESLQSAINKLNEFQQAGNLLEEYLVKSENICAYIFQQFSVPRLQREIHKSGKDMANDAKAIAEENIGNVQALEQDYLPQLSQAVEIIDSADRYLNGHGSRPALHNLPNLHLRG
jgi:hypothetical protein